MNDYTSFAIGVVAVCAAFAVTVSSCDPPASVAIRTRGAIQLECTKQRGEWKDDTCRFPPKETKP